MFGNKKKKERILTDGISAEAVVIDVADTGVTINNNPRVKLTLQVQPEGDAPFQAEKKVTVSRVEIPRPGDKFFVRYDPADPSEVEFDHGEGRRGGELGRRGRKSRSRPPPPCRRT